MKPISITLKLERRVSDGNYGHYGVELTETVELEEDETLAKVQARLFKQMNESLDADVEALTPEEPPKKKK